MGQRHTVGKTKLYSLPYAIAVVNLVPAPCPGPVGPPSPRSLMASASTRGATTEESGSDPALEIRPLVSPADFAACVQLQRATWGEEFREVVGATLLKIAQRVGGVAAGAFEPNGEMCGFVFGMTGIENGRPVHWSHMLAVRPDARDHGIGRKLKEFQSAWLLERNVDRVFWTFDPLVARNAHLNLNRLGVGVTEYIADMYGPDTGSPLHSGLGTDRLLVVWRLNGERVHAAADAGPEIHIEIPSDIQALKEADPFEAYSWRDSVRRAFANSLARGWRVTGFLRDAGPGRAAYVLRQTQEQGEAKQ
jgi:predicted GNAT superfamily acetyltransferase